MINANSSQEIIDFLKQLIAQEIKESVENIDADSNFFQFGFDSISSLYLIQGVEEHFDVQLNQLYFWDYPTIRLFAEQVYKEFTVA